MSIAAANTSETAMVQQTLAFAEPEVQPDKLIGDKGYDCDALEEPLSELGY